MNRIARRLSLLLVVVLPLAALAAEKKQYLVIAPHSPEECLSALDGLVEEKKLDKWDFGCMGGDHTGYLVTRAGSTEEALASVPANQRAKARVVELNKFSEAQVKSFHQGK
jgi:hypothetical protein